MNVAEPAARRVEVQEAHRLGPGEREAVRDAGRDRQPRARRRRVSSRSPTVAAQLALEHVERLGVAAVDVRADRGAARIRARLGDADLVDVGEQRDPHVGPVEDDLLAADDHVRGRADALGRRVLLVERRRPAVAQRAHVVGEAGARRVEVEVAQLGVARVAEAVDDERRHAHERPGRRGRLRVVLELERELAREDVEDVVVAAVDVPVGAVAARREARPGRVHRVLVGEDLDAPLGRVADDLAGAGRDDGRLAHPRESMRRVSPAYRRSRNARMRASPSARRSREVA